MKEGEQEKKGHGVGKKDGGEGGEVWFYFGEVRWGEKRNWEQKPCDPVHFYIGVVMHF